jgi:Domain of unknown function (DUF3854)
MTNPSPSVQRPGITETTLISAGVCYSDYPEPDSIEIPYWTPDGDVTKFRRWRLPTVRANGQKYHQEPGTNVYAYYPPGFFQHSRNGKYGLGPHTVVLVEGEFKTLSLLELGVYAIGLPSFVVYSKDEDGHRRLIRDLQVTLSKEKIQTIYFLGDADTASNFEFSRQAAFLASAAAPAQVWLPRIPYDTPKGIDDCKDALGPDFDAFFTEIIKAAIQLPKKIDPPSVALLLLEREANRIKALSGVDRERAFDRIERMCVAARRLTGKQATGRLCALAREIFGMNIKDFEAALKARAKEERKERAAEAVSATAPEKDPEEELAQKLEAEALSVAESVDAYYDQDRKEFVLKTKELQNYQSHSEAQFKRDLRFQRISGQCIPGRFWSQTDIVLQYLQDKKFVDYVGALAGKRCGFYFENGIRFLVTSEPKLIAPAKGKWKTLEKFLVQLLCGKDEPYGEAQLTALYGWLKVGFGAFRDRRFQPGQALAIAGPVESGKSLLQGLITQIFGGRCAKPALFLQGRTDFNGELFEAEHLMLEDEAASTTHAARVALAVKIKEITANRIQTCHPKFRPIVNLSPWWRLTISLNDRPERLLILPPLVEDIADKLILLRASCHPMPMPTDTAEEQQIFWNTLVAELPAFLHYLVNDFTITEDWRNARFGVRAFHHPMLLTELEELSPAIALLDLIDLANIWEVHSSVWEGTAKELRALLIAHHKTSRDADRLLHWTNACGQFLNDLARIRPLRVKPTRTHSNRAYEIYREIPI